MKDYYQSFVKYNRFHLAGIVAVTSYDIDFGMEWNDCLMPLAFNYTLLENAVMTCAMAGCETIWIVCDDGVKPLVKHRMGEWVRDPSHFFLRAKTKKTTKKNIALKERRIPIFYIPVLPRDKNRRDCFAWNMLYGAYRAHWICRKISRWVTPDRFIFCSPYGIVDLEEIKKQRKIFYKREYQAIFFRHNEKTIKNDLHLPVVLSNKMIIEYLKFIKNNGSLYEEKETDKYLSPMERYSARFFSLGEVFSCYNLWEKNYTNINVETFFDVSDWEKYRLYLSSEYAKVLKRPQRFFLSDPGYRLLRPMNQEPLETEEEVGTKYF